MRSAVLNYDIEYESWESETIAVFIVIVSVGVGFYCSRRSWKREKAMFYE